MTEFLTNIQLIANIVLIVVFIMHIALYRIERHHTSLSLLTNLFLRKVKRILFRVFSWLAELMRD